MSISSRLGLSLPFTPPSSVFRSWEKEGFPGSGSSVDVLPANRLGCISEELLQEKLSL